MKNQQEADNAPAEKKRSWGNIIYDFGVFGSIAWVGVAALSAISAHESQHGKNKYFGWLRTLNDKAYSGLRTSSDLTFQHNLRSIRLTEAA